MFINYVSLLKQRGALTRSHCGAACVDVGPVLHQVWSALISRVDRHCGGAEHGPGTWSAAGRRAGENKKKKRGLKDRKAEAGLTTGECGRGNTTDRSRGSR